MSQPLRVRVLAASDLAFADSLRELAGWNQTQRDWERFLAFEPFGCFLAEWNGAPAGVVTTISYGLELGWVGMLLVHPDYRRRGIGTALLKRAIAYLRDRGVRSIKLDATPEGKPTYLALGFRIESTLTRWEGSCVPETSARMRPWRPTDATAFAELDALAFGASRLRLLEALGAQSRIARVQEATGYGMSREGSCAFYLGPVVARTLENGLEIVECLLRELNGARVYWDILDQNSRVAQWAENNGFRRQRSLTRMGLGDSTLPSHPELQMAIAGPELG